MESAQGIAKSSALKCLVTFGSDERETYHTYAVSVGDWRNPHAMIKLQGSMFVELAELKGFSHQDDASIKNWITQQYDEIKLPYDRHTTRFPRQFVFAATTNKNDYLKDPTGNRRYWPFTVEKLIDLIKLADEREQLWAEAVWNWREGLYIGPTPEENELAEIERQKRLTQDPWEDKVMEIIAYLNKDKIKVVDILNHMKELKLTDKNELTARRVSSILQMQGFENKSIWNGITKVNERLWVRK
jgi:putative DNA primase/helicase